MKTLETILAFLTSLARIIFPRRQKSAAGDCPCPHPYPRPLPDGDQEEDEDRDGDKGSHRLPTFACGER